MSEHLQLPDAARRLQALVRQRHVLDFEWGVRDCFLWAADAAVATTGHDPADGLRGTYHDAWSAMRLLRRLGGWAGVLRDRWGQQVAVRDAMDGDALWLDAGVCTPEGGDTSALGVQVLGWAVAQGAGGLVIVPRKHVLAAWRVAR